MKALSGHPIRKFLFSWPVAVSPPTLVKSITSSRGHKSGFRTKSNIARYHWTHRRWRRLRPAAPSSLGDDDRERALGRGRVGVLGPVGGPDLEVVAADGERVGGGVAGARPRAGGERLGVE